MFWSQKLKKVEHFGIGTVHSADRLLQATRSQHCTENGRFLTPQTGITVEAWYPTHYLTPAIIQWNHMVWRHTCNGHVMRKRKSSFVTSCSKSMMSHYVQICDEVGVYISHLRSPYSDLVSCSWQFTVIRNYTPQRRHRLRTLFRFFFSFTIMVKRAIRLQVKQRTAVFFK